MNKRRRNKKHRIIINNHDRPAGIVPASECEKGLAELEAIDSVRNELAHAVQHDYSPADVAIVHQRLMNLYAALDIHNVVSIIDRIKYKNAA